MTSNIPWGSADKTDPMTAFMTTAQASFVNHTGSPVRKHAIYDYQDNLSRARHPAEWASHGDKLAYLSSYKSTFLGQPLGTGYHKIPPIPRTVLGHFSAQHEEYVAAHRAALQAAYEPYPSSLQRALRKVPLPTDPVPPRRADGVPPPNPHPNLGGHDEHGRFNILNGSDVPEYAVPKHPGTFFAGRVTSKTIEAKVNGRKKGENFLAHPE
ncbi:hypothetical protein AMAG_15954 [Allomyces macrogynus ATCC 38327]|uniref:Uncharacterized protein n=1 Tax=Allomyces macrogynus (strain ATCC 38327) TaxID=578462 RepID=A0A0L0TB54_ALLM3|nr:hypothetical protein AMAG_15954 [Allomyces macrogynus ATCC 38327]|eukprot:KNE72013.1 hypothetical protein AMAG_15954 [Allomyces macrogynus ATCC 38327]